MKPDGKPVYIAAVEEKVQKEAEKNNCRRYVVEKGMYATQTILSWRSKTDTVKDVFREMMDQPNIDKTKPCVEWYKNDHEMWCMLKRLPKKLTP